MLLYILRLYYTCILLNVMEMLCVVATDTKTIIIHSYIQYVCVVCVCGDRNLYTHNTLLLLNFTVCVLAQSKGREWAVGMRPNS